MKLHFRVIVIDFSCWLSSSFYNKVAWKIYVSVICVLVYLSGSLGKGCFKKLFSLNVALSGQLCSTFYGSGKMTNGKGGKFYKDPLVAHYLICHRKTSFSSHVSGGAWRDNVKLLWCLCNLDYFYYMTCKDSDNVPFSIASSSEKLFPHSADVPYLRSCPHCSRPSQGPTSSWTWRSHSNCWCPMKCAG